MHVAQVEVMGAATVAAAIATHILHQIILVTKVIRVRIRRQAFSVTVMDA